MSDGVRAQRRFNPMKVTVVVRLAFIALVLTAHASFAQIPQATVTGGAIAGTVSEGLSVFKGIPFAASPIGDRRWTPPQPVEPWQGVRQTTAVAPACVQNDVAVAAVSPSEDCLCLNVWTPAKTSDEKLPVIVWIHGGDFSGGSAGAAIYDGASLARKGVVFVSIAYRLGPFGFLATPDLSKERGHGSGNYGLLDQIAALQWVKANIASFGGNPSRVTLLGESAGALSVSMLAGSELASDLFFRVIVDGGANFLPPQVGPWTGAGIQTLGFAEGAGRAWLGTLGATTLADARALPAAKLVEAAAKPGAPRFSPSFDGYVIAGDQYQLWQEGRFNRTDVLLGMTSEQAASSSVRRTDAATFTAQVRKEYGKHADDILSVYPHDTDEQASRSVVELQIDTSSVGLFIWARLQNTRSFGSCYVYYVDRAAGADPSASNPLVELIQTYWINFATWGNPNEAGLPVWPPFSDAHDTVMRFGISASQVRLPHRERLQVLERYYQWRREGSNEN